MLAVKPITKDSPDFEEVKQIYLSEFPRDERAPMWILLWKAKKDSVEFLACYDEDTLIGFVYLILWEKVTFILFFAVNNKLQSKGYGSKILGLVKDRYPGNKIVLDIEILDEKAWNYEQRKRRRSFYLKNGYEPTGVIMQESSMAFELLVNGGAFVEEELHSLFRSYLGSVIYFFNKPKLVRQQNSSD